MLDLRLRIRVLDVCTTNGKPTCSIHSLITTIVCLGSRANNIEGRAGKDYIFPLFKTNPIFDSVFSFLNTLKELVYSDASFQ